MVNWNAIVLGFISTLILAYLGKYIPYLDMTIAPIMGGIISGYMVGGSYRDGGIYGGFSAGIAGFIYTLLIIILSAGVSLAATVSMNIVPMSMYGVTWILTLGIILLGAILSFIMYFILGLFGGLIGIAIKERNAEKQILRS
jgi:hypothetical protein